MSLLIFTSAASHVYLICISQMHVTFISLDEVYLIFYSAGNVTMTMIGQFVFILRNRNGIKIAQPSST